MLTARTLTALLAAPAVLAAAFASPEESPLRLQIDDQKIVVREGGQARFVYNIAKVPAPPGIDPVNSTSGYIHPVFTPSGQAISGDFPPSHPHHHGIWMAWTKTEFKGQTIDFWNAHKQQGYVSHQELQSTEQTKDRLSFTVSLAHFAILDGRPIRVLDEVWTVTAYPAQEEFYSFDIATRQTLAASSPLQIQQYHYGGAAWRATEQWLDPQDVAILTSQGHDRIEGNSQPARWVAMQGSIDGQTSAIAILSHPDNYRSPQPARLHPKMPYFCWTPGTHAPFTISEDHPYRARYRYLVASQPLDPQTVEQQWHAFAEHE